MREGEDLLRDMIDRGDENEYTCPVCKKKFAIRELVRRYTNSTRAAWLSLAGREGYEYDCPDDGALVTSKYTCMS